MCRAYVLFATQLQTVIVQISLHWHSHTHTHTQLIKKGWFVSESQPGTKWRDTPAKSTKPFGFISYRETVFVHLDTRCKRSTQKLIELRKQFLIMNPDRGHRLFWTPLSSPRWMTCHLYIMTVCVQILSYLPITSPATDAVKS